MKISACVVTYNSICTPEKKEKITDCITSLLENTCAEFDFYIVDNASADGTAQYIKENFPDVKVIENSENLGFGAAHNKVIDIIDSDFHFIVNPDIFVKTDVLNIMATFMRENENVGAVNPLVRFPDGRLQPLAKRQPKFRYLFANHLTSDREKSKLVREYCMLDADYSAPVKTENLSGCFMGVRTSVFKKLGGFDDAYFMYFEDFDLARRIMKENELYIVPEAVVYHAWERDSKTNSSLLKIHIKSMFTYIRKWRMGI